jgi:site-specific DNA-methyltransferase (adenine-specific)
LDSGRIPTSEIKIADSVQSDKGIWHNAKGGVPRINGNGTDNPQGRFPANLLVSDDILNDGQRLKSSGNRQGEITDSKARSWKNQSIEGIAHIDYNDTGSFSRYFSLDSWWDDRIKKLPESVQKTFPFIIMPKASKAEKNKGCEGLEEKRSGITNFQPENGILYRMENGEITNTKAKTYQRNHHPTVKPIKLFSYLITLGSREGDLILDPFCGSGTSAVACKALNRHYVCIERESEYVAIAEARIKAEHSQPELALAGG